MRVLLLSSGAGALPAFLEEAVRPGALRIGYVPDAALPDAALPDPGAPFASSELERIAAFGHRVEVVRLSGSPLDEIEQALDRVDALYVAGGNTFALLHAMRSTGADRAITDRVRAGLPYIGLSAGSVVAGPTIEPITLMDDPTEAPELGDRSGLGLVDTVVVPHAGGLSPLAEVTGRIVAEYGARHPLRLLTDDQALVLDGRGEGLRLIASH
ncbi:Type 1 glutamine amidotransferase-like domain-containing protein [Leifsonia sp. NPDC058194]|uniref:Type 1 glutamine amidotransferase-like domain-containing protein n=1 Tax=Leifsonia sp. NPDC058194 TaxID=3346374 RepID=UPI0036DAF19A